jgi:hypothetical protein
MTRAVQLMTLVCAASLLGNIWLYRELRVRKHDAPHTVASLAPKSQGVVPDVNAVAATQAAIAPAALSKSTSKAISRQVQ